MSKKLFHPEGVPTEPQVSGQPDFTSDAILEANPYVMRGRMALGQNTGVWSVVNLPEFKYGSDTDGEWTSGTYPSKLYQQKSTVGTGTGEVVTGIKFYDTSQNSYIEYVKEITINLDEDAAVNAPTTGVDVWFRWMPALAFQTFSFEGSGGKINGLRSDFVDTPQSIDDIPVGAWQKNGKSSIDQVDASNPFWEPSEWSFVGTRFSNSFSVTVPMPPEYTQWEAYWEGLGVGKPADGFRKLHVNDYFSEVWFQVLITSHSTWKPDKYNYRWIGNTDQYLSADFDTGMWTTYQRYWSEGASTGAINDAKVGEYVADLRTRPVTSTSVTNTYRTAGYLPWNPHYGMTKTDQWNTYRRQRTTFGDIAIFAPRRWRKWFTI